jgi:hypothetical protein
LMIKCDLVICVPAAAPLLWCAELAHRRVFVTYTAARRLTVRPLECVRIVRPQE